MAANADAVLKQWAGQLRQQRWGVYVAAFLEAFEPLAPVGAVLWQGGQWLVSPWMNGERLQPLALLLEDREQRRRFLRMIVSSSGEPLP